MRLRIAGVVLLVVGAVSIALAVQTATARAAFARTGVRAAGTVTRIGYESGRRGTGGPTYFPYVRYTTAAGEAVVFRADLRERRSWSGARGSSFTPSDRVEVIYDPAAPQRAVVADSLRAVWIGVTRPILSGLLGLALGVLCLRPALLRHLATPFMRRTARATGATPAG